MTPAICPCCVAQGLLYRGAYLYADMLGPDEAVAVCRDIADSIEHPDDIGMPEHHTQH